MTAYVIQLVDGGYFRESPIPEYRQCVSVEEATRFDSMTAAILHAYANGFEPQQFRVTPV